MEVRSDIVFQDIFSSNYMELLKLLLSQLLKMPFEDVEDKFEIRNIILAKTSIKEK